MLNKEVGEQDKEILPMILGLHYSAQERKPLFHHTNMEYKLQLIKELRINRVVQNFPGTETTLRTTEGREDATNYLLGHIRKPS